MCSGISILLIFLTATRVIFDGFIFFRKMVHSFFVLSQKSSQPWYEFVTLNVRPVFFSWITYFLSRELIFNPISLPIKFACSLLISICAVFSKDILFIGIVTFDFVIHIFKNIALNIVRCLYLDID